MSKKNKRPPTHNGIAVIKVSFNEPRKLTPEQKLEQDWVIQRQHATIEEYETTRRYGENFRDWESRTFKMQEEVL